ncbi:MAG: RNA polymerase sigma factor RpoH [Desulfuromonadales bacterium]|nr:RNA polymerase sigma factor RpoH [Desulfuromonadales bacterium]
MSTLSLPVTTDTFEHYMTQINRFELLSAEQEYQLGLKHLEQGDTEAAHKLICANLRFVVKVANEYRSYGLRLLDLIQEGNIGLMMAVKKFDPTRGNRLITYAVWWIRAYIQNFIMRSWSMVKIGTTQAQKKLFYKLGQTRRALQNLTGSDPTQQIAQELEVEEQTVVEMSQRLERRDASLDLELTPGEGYSLVNTLVEPGQNQEEQLLEQQQQTLRQKWVAKALSALKPREQEILTKRILSEAPSTLQELANQFGVSRERIRQIEQNALKKLKRQINDAAQPEAIAALF